jgi:signal transduction histidine kinase
VNFSALTAASASVLLLFVAFILRGLSHAPGWERARAFAPVAATAAAYTVGDLFNVSTGPSAGVQLWASRFQYFFASLHALAWLHFAFTPPPQGAVLQRAGRGLMAACLVMAVVALVPGLAIQPQLYVLEVPLLGVSYSMFNLTLLGDLGGAMILVSIALSFARLMRQGREGEVRGWGRVGFGVFFACAAVDFAVAAGVMRFVPLAGIGFLAALLPVAMHFIRGFVHNARRLDRLSRDLSREVRERTDDVLRVERDLADAERHASIGRVAAAVAHDINNPLAWLILNTDLLRDFTSRHPLPDEANESISGIVEGAERIKTAVESLRARTRWSPGMRVVVSPGRLLRVAVKASTADLHRTHDMTLVVQPTPLVVGDEGDLMSAFADLLSCARRLPSGHRGQIPLAVMATTAEDGWAAISVTVPHGPVLDQAPRATDAFTSEHDATLAGVLAVMEHHGGTLEVLDARGLWTARLRLPPSSQQVTTDGRVGGEAVALIG